ncbi:MAG: tail fiber domain-containing protein [Bacteroidota bacterium]
MKHYLVLLISLLSLSGLFAQSEGVSINATGNDPAPSSILDIQSSSKGILIPRLTATERDAITSPATGLMVFVTTDARFYYYNGAAWQAMAGSAGGYDWSLTGNTGTDPNMNFIGTTDSTGFVIRTNNDTIFRFLPNGNMIGGGSSNQITGGTRSVIEGGAFNVITNDYASIGGGADHVVSGAYASISGGIGNDASDFYAYVGGGSNNNATGIGTSIVGGTSNTASEPYAFVGGGEMNAVSGSDSFIGGGGQNTASNNYSVVVGGNQNISSGLSSYVGGGILNTASETVSFVGGGELNNASERGATIGGGFDNEASGVGAFIGSGSGNIASADRAVVVGGFENVASGVASFVGGGHTNIASSYGETVLGLFSDPYTPNSTNTFDANDRIFTIGNGTSFTDRSNAMTVLKNGHVGIGTNEPVWPLTLAGNMEMQGQNGQIRFRDFGGIGGSFIQQAAIRTNINAPNSISSFQPTSVSMNFDLPAENDGTTATIMTLRGDGNVGIGTNNPASSAILNIESTERGLLIPRMTDSERNAIASPVNGLLVYSTTDNRFSYYNGGNWNTVGDNLGNHTATENLTIRGNRRKITFRSQSLNNTQIGEIRTDFDPPLGAALLNSATVHMSFHLPTTNGGGTHEVMSLQGDGSVGINVTNPTTTLDISGSIEESRPLRIVSNFDPNISPLVSEPEGGIILANGMLNEQWEIIHDMGNTGGLRINHTASNGNIYDVLNISRDNTNGGGHVGTVAFQESRVGIGTLAPANLLHLNFPAAQGDSTGLQLSAGGANSLFYHQNGDLIIRKLNQVNQLVLDQSGRIGIGTHTPQAPLHVGGSSTTASFTGGSWLNENSATSVINGISTATLPTAQNVGVSIYASGSIVADGEGVFVAATVNWSDARIKNIEGISDASEDLQTLSDIEVTDYRRIHGGQPEKKVIAQQLREVFPQAVSLREGVIPSIYAHIKDFSYDTETELLTIHAPASHELVVGDFVDYYTELQKYGKVEVVEIVSANTFRVKAETAPVEVFVFGKWVDDVHSVDYDAISMLNVSATQEQQRLINAQQERIEALELELSSQKGEMNKMKTTFEARLRALEAALVQP